MNKSEMVKVIDKVLPRMQFRLGLNSWLLKIEFGYCGDDDTDVDAAVRFDRNYRHASIIFNPEETKDRARLLGNIRHELLHLLLAPMQDFKNVTCRFAKPFGDVTWAPMDEVYDQSIEASISAVERAMDFSGMTPKYLARKLEKGEK